MATLVQWNIWYQEDPKNIVSQLKEWDADIVTIQEATQGMLLHDKCDTARYIAEQLGFELHFQAAHNWSLAGKPEESIGNAILSRYPLQKQTHFYVQTPGPEKREVYSEQGRVYVEADVELPTGVVTVGTVHLSYTDHFKPMDHQIAETAKLLEIVNHKTERYFLTGDFNALPESDVVNSLESYLQHCGPDYRKPTWTTKKIEYNDFYEDQLRYRMDYVFATRDIQIHSAEILPTPFSDHLPVVVKF
jgi:endonuclease/exonuclease/phosphatase family metal-dependent hydrolase